MAASTNASEGGTISDINVTPLVDVVLVLLIIMMVAAPIISSKSSLDLNLPKVGNASDKQPTEDKRLSIIVKEPAANKDAVSPIFINGDPVDPITAKDDEKLKNHIKQAALSMGFQPADFSNIDVEFAVEARVIYQDMARLLAFLSELEMTKVKLSVDDKP